MFSRTAYVVAIFVWRTNGAFLYYLNKEGFAKMPSFNKGSYTEYSNKIGLYSNSQESFIAQSPDVVLNFPYKDCILEGGMTKEDAKRDERFLNVKLDKRDIDTLFDPKVLTNFKYIDGNGERELSANDDIEFFDKNGELKQNLLIKGNNLVALHTLKERLAGKVKLIYIDPPYNTGNDGFKYNDHFNHSAYLTFMSNRLKTARSLMADDGSIFIHCDDNECAYLRAVADEIFGCDFYITSIPRIASYQRSGQEKYMNVSHDYIIVYSYALDFNNCIERNLDNVVVAEDKNGKYIPGDTKAILAAKSQGYSKGGDYDFEYNGKIYMPVDSKGVRNRWLWSRERMEAAAKLGILVETPTTLRMQVYIDKKFDEKTNTMVPKDKKLRFHTADFMSSKKFDNPVGVFELEKVLGYKDTTITPKPEGLMQAIVEMATSKNDIVLDFCLGSGTTAAVAHKMGRRWIGIEQMDYIETIAKERLKKVIAGEQGGISKSVNWQGGGSFVYVELKKYNQEYVDQINAATNMTELEEVYKKMYQNAFLKFWFDKKTFERDERFRSMDLNTRKQALISILDENQLYLNYADMDDAKYHVSDDERALTKCFYGDRLDNDDDTEAEE